jgi:hypothetical protein
MRTHALLCAIGIALAAEASAQTATDPKPAKNTTQKKADSVSTPPIFMSETPLAVTFTTNIRQLRGDRSGAAPWRAATLSYSGSDGKRVTVPVRAKTHGIWRLKHCDFPPVRLHIGGKESKGTLLHHLGKPKLTNACKNNADYEQYLLQELQLYRIYQVVTPASHKARLLKVTYADSASGREEMVRYAFVLEDPDLLAARLGGHMVKTKGAGPDDLDPEQAATTYVFQYLIANTDFSFNGLHNGELVLRDDGNPVLPVAYDFDFAGAVNAPYATVDPKLPVKRVRDRVFRGYCAHASSYPAAFTLFQQKKDAIYALYSDEVGKLLDPRIVRETLEYFDDFYRTIKTPHDAEQIVVRACLGPR